METATEGVILYTVQTHGVKKLITRLCNLLNGSNNPSYVKKPQKQPQRKLLEVVFIVKHDLIEPNN